MIDCFNSSELTKASAASVANKPISDLVASYLIEVGLPSFEVAGLSFLNVEILPTFSRSRSDLHSLQSLKCVSLGKVNDTQLLLTDQEKIILVSLDDPSNEWFVNSDIAKLSLFIVGCVRHFRQTMRSDSRREIQASALDLRKYMQNIDPDALEGSMRYWSVIMEQIEIGLI